MKVKNVILPIVAFVVAVGMAFATTPINEFQTEVWSKPKNQITGCEPTLCAKVGENECLDIDEGHDYFATSDCTGMQITPKERVQ